MVVGTPTPFDVARSAAPSRHLVETAVAHGLDAAACLQGCGLTPTDLDDPATVIRADQELAIIRNVIAGLGDLPGLGAEVGSRYSMADTGILGYALLASPTFGDAVEVACRFGTLTATLFTLAAPSVTDTEAIITFDHKGIPADVRRFIIERDVNMLLRFLPPMLGILHSPVTIRLELADLETPAELTPVENFILDVEHSDRNALCFPIELMGRALPVADPQTAARCVRQCEELLNRRRERRGISAAVRTRMIQNSHEMPSMRVVADELGMTQRTLRRKLDAEGTTYRALLDEVRATLAAEFLEAGLSVEEVAHRLGYSETSAFTHAHIRWNGHPPSRRRM